MYSKNLGLSTKSKELFQETEKLQEKNEPKMVLN